MNLLQCPKPDAFGIGPDHRRTNLGRGNHLRLPANLRERLPRPFPERLLQLRSIYLFQADSDLSPLSQDDERVAVNDANDGRLEGIGARRKRDEHENNQQRAQSVRSHRG